eukprot:2226423-Amphidinium_carterae.1
MGSAPLHAGARGRSTMKKVLLSPVRERACALDASDDLPLVRYERVVSSKRRVTTGMGLLVDSEWSRLGADLAWWSNRVAGATRPGPRAVHKRWGVGQGGFRAGAPPLTL